MFFFFAQTWSRLVLFLCVLYCSKHPAYGILAALLVYFKNALINFKGVWLALVKV